MIRHVLKKYMADTDFVAGMDGLELAIGDHFHYLLVNGLGEQNETQKRICNKDLR